MYKIFILLLFFGPVSVDTTDQTVVCKTIKTSGYNTKSESAYLRRIEKVLEHGCGAVAGREIFFKNTHPKKIIKGFVVKKWKYTGYETYDVCEMHYFELKPGELSKSMGCNYISQTQPCEFKPYGKFDPQN